MNTARQYFGSRIGALLTPMRVAVGLANVWRFPYMMGQYGGSAFLIVYLGCMAVIAVPALMAEWALGRETRQGPMFAYRKALRSRWGYAIGALILVTVAVAGSYYILVIAQVAITGAFALFRGFDPPQVEQLNTALTSFHVQYPVAAGLVLASLFVSYRGLNAGISRISTITVPLFLAVLVYLIFNTLRIDGAGAALVEYLRPDFGSMGPREYFAVLGQTCFSVGLGGSYMLAYGSYLPNDLPLGRTAVATVVGDTGAALAAGMFLVPATIVLAVPLASGPSLIFDTMPALFPLMPGGEILGGVFLMALALVALLSYLPVIQILIDAMDAVPGIRVSRGQAICLVGILELLLMLPTALDPGLIGILDLIFGSGMQLFGTAIAATALGWGLGKSALVRQHLVPATGKVLSAVITGWFRWVLPAVLFTVLIVYLVSLVLD